MVFSLLSLDAVEYTHSDKFHAVQMVAESIIQVEMVELVHWRASNVGSIDPLSIKVTIATISHTHFLYSYIQLP